MLWKININSDVNCHELEMNYCSSRSDTFARVKTEVKRM